MNILTNMAFVLAMTDAETESALEGIGEGFFWIIICAAAGYWFWKKRS